MVKLSLICWGFVIMFSTASTRKPNKILGLPGRLVQRFYLVGPCPKNFSTSSRINSAFLTDLGPSKGIRFNMDVTFFRQIDRATEIVIQIKNCNDQTLGSCQLFQTWRMPVDGCKLWEQKNSIWTPIFENIKPTPNCPFRKRDYSLTNGSLDMSVLERLPYPLEKYFWRVQTECYDPALFFCSELGGRVMRARE